METKPLKKWADVQEAVQDLHNVKVLFVASVLSNGGKLVIKDSDIKRASEGMTLTRINKPATGEVHFIVDDCKLFYVIFAGHGRQAMNYVKKKGLRVGRYKIIHVAEDLRGWNIADCRFILTGLWWKSEEYSRLKAIADSIGIQFETDGI